MANSQLTQAFRDRIARFKSSLPSTPQPDTTFCCPITRCVFNIPVLAEDGHLYERSAIEEWFSNNNTSPVTRMTIGKKLFGCKWFQDQLDEYLKNNPEQKDNQYKIELTFAKLKEILRSDKFSELLNYTNFSMTTLHATNMQHKLLKSCEFSIFKHVIDNMDDLSIRSCYLD